MRAGSEDLWPLFKPTALTAWERWKTLSWVRNPGSSISQGVTSGKFLSFPVPVLKQTGLSHRVAMDRHRLVFACTRGQGHLADSSPLSATVTAVQAGASSVSLRYLHQNVLSKPVFRSWPVPGAPRWPGKAMAESPPLPRPACHTPRRDESPQSRDRSGPIPSPPTAAGTFRGSPMPSRCPDPLSGWLG